MSSDGTREDCERENCPGCWNCWGDYYRDDRDEVKQAVADLKRELGHDDHEGWQADGLTGTTYCGCGAELYSMPRRYAVGIGDQEQP